MGYTGKVSGGICSVSWISTATIDCLLTARRDNEAALRFLKKAIIAEQCP